jgi:hypothetical protein
MSDVTRILSAIEQGDPHAAGQLLPLVYEELRRLAVGRGAQGMSDPALPATAPGAKKNLPRPHNSLPLYALNPGEGP